MAYMINPKKAGARGTGSAGRPLAPPNNHNDQYCLRRIKSKSLIPASTYLGYPKYSVFTQSRSVSGRAGLPRLPRSGQDYFLKHSSFESDIMVRSLIKKYRRISSYV
jgi:hypothetical protein